MSFSLQCSTSTQSSRVSTSSLTSNATSKRVVQRKAFRVRAADAAAAPVAASKIRIRLKSFETTHMQAACDKIIEAATATEARIKGPIPLPTKRRIYCVLRSPHVNKDSRESTLKRETHNRVIDVYEPTAQTIDALMGLELPAGVDIRVKL
ncbi:unnamed protein product [Bathycoccus prasinos]